jgi:NTP pyrophosphatase (non-canonical NTP hydrolase)
MKINDLVIESHDRARRKGFYEVEPSIPERLCLIHSEVSEALEASQLNANGKPEGLPSELADIIIRVADMAGWMGIDLEHELRMKGDYNETRPQKHGRARL